jgi:uncharacterized membrane protein YbhN (UPF0104 family)
VEIIRDTRIPSPSSMSVPQSSLKSQPSEIVEHRSWTAYSVLRLFIGFTVVAFVVFAGWKGVLQLRAEDDLLTARIADLRAQTETPQRREAIEGLVATRLRPANMQWSLIVAAAGTYTVALVCSAMFWHACLTAFGQPAHRMITIAAHVLGQIGKYVPGKAMVVLIRAAAIHRHAGVGRVAATIGVFVETLTMMACGATLAGVAVLMLPAPGWIRAMAVLLAMASAIPTLPPLFHIVLRRLSKSRLGRRADFAVDRYDWTLMVVGWSWMTVTWLLIATSFWLVTLATPGVAAEMGGVVGYATAGATIALAMVAGFLSLIPGGAGVRELVITALLAPLVGTGVAMVAALIARLLFLVVECLASGLSWWLIRMLAAKPIAVGPAH